MIKKNNILNKNSSFINLFYENRVFLAKDHSKRAALFLDRDGVVIKDKNFISNSKDVELEYGVLNLFKLLNNLDIPIIIITNQSGISRGYFGWEDYLTVSESMVNKIGEDNTLIAIYANGLHPSSPTYSWRKPSPSMILNASFTLDIDLEKSVIIGDRLSDLISGMDAGIQNLIHIKTGHGSKERKIVKNYFNNLKVPKETIFINKFSCETLNIIEKLLKYN